VNADTPFLGHSPDAPDIGGSFAFPIAGGDTGTVPAGEDTTGIARPRPRLVPPLPVARLLAHEVLFARAPVGFALFDSDLRFVRLNEAMADINLTPVEAHLGRTLIELYGEEAQSAHGCLQRARDSGEAFTVEISGRRSDGEYRWYSASYYPVIDDADGFAGVAAVVLDTTHERAADAQRAEALEAERRARNAAERVAWENERLRVLAADLAEADSLERAAARIASAITLMLPQAVEAGVYRLDRAGRVLRRLAQEGDTARGIAAEEYAAVPLRPGLAPVADAVLEHRALVLETDADWAPYPAALREDVRRSGHPVVACFPLVARGDALGALYVNFPPGRDLGEAPDDPDVPFLAAVADMSAQTLDRLALLEDERRTRGEFQALLARLQAALLPPADAGGADGRVLTLYRAGDERMLLGGDFFDVIDRGGRLSLIIGDVAGHGPESAGLGAQLRSAWRALVLAGVPLEGLLPALNAVALSANPEGERFVTVACAEEGDDGVRLAVAGHPPPLLLGGGAPRPLEVPGGLPLGVLEEARWPLAPAVVDGGRQLLLFTDGLFEGRRTPGSGERLDYGGLIALLEREGRGALDEAGLRRVVAAVEAAHGGGLPDDVAVVALGLPTSARPA
jgi:PAS domain S-box-containing protein